MELTSNNKLDGSSSLLAPGFRFHPTDEELVRYYLRRKICGKGFRFDAISEIDIYKAEPWDLPSMSKLKTRDLEWYFFSFLDKKYGNGARTNRATEKGYWKTTGKDRAVYHRAQIVGMKKTLVYHNGRAPKGLRTNWVMHEYRLTDLESVGVVKDAFVLCRVFQKSGSGPKNGEQYGAPFVEEEWENDELEVVPKVAQTVEKVDFGDDAYLDGLYLDQILQSENPSDTVPLPLDCHSTDSNYIQGTVKPENGTQHALQCAEKRISGPEQQIDDFSDLPALFETELQPVKDEYVVESSDSANYDDLDLDFLLDEQFHDAYDGFIETNDFANPIDMSAVGMLNEYLMNDDEKSQQYYDSPVFNTGSKKPVYDDLLLPQKELYDGTQQAAFPNEQFVDYNSNDTQLLSDKQELTRCQSGYQYQFMKQASQMLGNIPAPPAFAAEFPSKEAILRLNSVAQSTNLVHMVIRNPNMLSAKNENKFNVVVSFGYARGEDGSSSLQSSVSIPSWKNLTGILSGVFHSKFFWILALSVSFQIGACVLAH